MAKRRKRRRRPTPRPDPAPARATVNEKPLIERLAERGFLSPRQYEVAAKVQRAAHTIATWSASRSILWSEYRTDEARAQEIGRQEVAADRARLLSLASIVAKSIHVDGPALLLHACVMDRSCRTFDREKGWRNGTAANLLGAILTALADSPRMHKTANFRGTTNKGLNRSML